MSVVASNYLINQPLPVAASTTGTGNLPISIGTDQAFVVFEVQDVIPTSTSSMINIDLISSASTSSSVVILGTISVNIMSPSTTTFVTNGNQKYVLSGYQINPNYTSSVLWNSSTQTASFWIGLLPTGVSYSYGNPAYPNTQTINGLVMGYGTTPSISTSIGAFVLASNLVSYYTLPVTCCSYLSFYTSPSWQSTNPGAVFTAGVYLGLTPSSTIVWPPTGSCSNGADDYPTCTPPPNPSNSSHTVIYVAVVLIALVVVAGIGYKVYKGQQTKKQKAIKANP